MTQPTLFTTTPRFDGETVEVERDDDRLRCQLQAVLAVASKIEREFKRSQVRQWRERRLA